MADRHRSSPFYSSLKIFGWIVLALMVLSILYAGWTSLVNWSYIRV